MQQLHNWGWSNLRKTATSRPTCALSPASTHVPMARCSPRATSVQDSVLAHIVNPTQWNFRRRHGSNAPRCGTGVRCAYKPQPILPSNSTLRTHVASVCVCKAQSIKRHESIQCSARIPSARAGTAHVRDVSSLALCGHDVTDTLPVRFAPHRGIDVRHCRTSVAF